MFLSKANKENKKVKTGPIIDKIVTVFLELNTPDSIFAKIKKHTHKGKNRHTNKNSIAKFIFSPTNTIYLFIT